MRFFIFLAVAGFLVTSACTSTSTVPVKSLKLTDITATAPAGYCLDPEISRPADGFAVMAPCVTLGGSDSAPDVVAIATVQVGASGSGVVAGAEDDLVALLESDAGAVLLSQTNDGALIDILGTEIGENTVNVNFSDAGNAPIDGMDNLEWRAFTDIGGRLVTVSVRGLAAAPLAEGTGSWLLNLVVTGMVPANGDNSIEISDS